MSASTGGPAFPQPLFQGPAGTTNPWDGWGVGGLSVRDYFAAKALQGLLADPTWNPATKELGAAQAYKWADAMLVERNKP